MFRKDIHDIDFGKLLVKVNSHARNIILYTRADGLHITIPPGVDEAEVLQAVEKFRERLLKDQKTVEDKWIDLNYKIDAEFFKLDLVQGTHDKFLARSEPGVMRIICPADANFHDKQLQAWLRKVIGEALRRNAKIILPPRLKEFSEKLNLPFEQVRINSSKGRWGSCSSRKHINLSYYLILLPAHLIDYVLIHELCHTKEMNHSKKFWALMSKYTDGKAGALRAELRKYKTEFL